MDWALVAFLLLVVGCIAGGITVIVTSLDFVMNSLDVWNTRENLVVLVSGFVSIFTLSGSYLVIHKKL